MEPRALLSCSIFLDNRMKKRYNNLICARRLEKSAHVGEFEVNHHDE